MAFAPNPDLFPQSECACLFFLLFFIFLVVRIFGEIPKAPLPDVIHSNLQFHFLPPSFSSLSVNLSKHSVPSFSRSFMELQRRQDQSLSQRKGQKRKLDEEQHHEDRQILPAPPTADERAALLSDVAEQVSILESTFTWNEADRSAAKRATHALADLAKNGKKSMPPPISPRVAAFVWIAVSVWCFLLLCFRVSLACACRL